MEVSCDYFNVLKILLLKEKPNSRIRSAQMDNLEFIYGIGEEIEHLIHRLKSSVT